MRTEIFGEKHAPPRTARDILPFSQILPDGTMRCGGAYSKTFSFSDVNYAVLGEEKREEMFMKYCAILNSFDAAASYKITLVRSKSGESSVPGPFGAARRDGLDGLRKEFSALASAPGKSVPAERKYLTVSVRAKNAAEAEEYFSRAEKELSSKFSSLGSRLEGLSAEARLALFYGMLRRDGPFEADLAGCARYGHDIRDLICPDYVERAADYTDLGGRYARVLYMKDFASYIKDSLLADLASSGEDMVLSVDILPVNTDDAVREVERRLLGVETNITNWQRKQNSARNFSAVIPYDMELQRKESKEFLNDLKSRDQRMMFGLITAAVFAPSVQELDASAERLRAASRRHMCQMAVLRYQQTEGLATVLPFGVSRINTLRTLTTESLAVFMPFRAQEIDEPDGIYLGKNAVSGQRIMCNRENLVNQSAMILGIPGSGKSMCAKSIILQLLLAATDDILICDPEGEYAAMLREMDLPGCEIIDMAPGGTARLNAMEMPDGCADAGALAVKSDFIMSLIEQIDSAGTGPRQKSIADRCLAKTFSVCRKEGIEPTLTVFRECLLSQSEPEAKDIALSLELYTSGSLDIFAREGNVNLNAPVTCFDISSLPAQLKSAGLLVITNTILNRVSRNFKRGRRTHVFIDEFHVVYENEYSAAFFTGVWRQFRKRNAYPTAITQNVEYLLSSVSASTMLSNSELVIMLSQAPSDREKLKSLLGLSDAEIAFAVNAEPGSGLIKYGGILLPFENSIPESSRIYALMSTRPGEGAYGKEGREKTGEKGL